MLAICISKPFLISDRSMGLMRKIAHGDCANQLDTAESRQFCREYTSQIVIKYLFACGPRLDGS